MPYDEVASEKCCPETEIVPGDEASGTVDRAWGHCCSNEEIASTVTPDWRGDGATGKSCHSLNPAARVMSSKGEWRLRAEGKRHCKPSWIEIPSLVVVETGCDC